MVGPRFISVLVFFLACAAAQNAISTVAGGNPPVTPVAAVQASVGDPARVATDGSGNIYFGALHSVFRVDTSGVMMRIAGNGRSGYSGDGGPATAAQLQTPAGIAVDGAGNIYVADRDASVVREISSTGTITTVAGTGTAGFNGDGGQANQAQLNVPMGLAMDGAGNLFIADSENQRIRKVSTNGTISTVAGNGGGGYGGDGGPATATELDEPEGVAVDAAGNIYIADTVNDRVREVSANGNISTVAGTGVSAVYGSIWDETGVSTTTGDNGPATSAAVVLPTDVTVDRAGNLYIADYGNARIRLVIKTVITTLAGLSTGIPPTDGQAAVSARLAGPTGLAVDAAGNVYFAEGSIATGSGLGNGDYRIWKITTDGILKVAAGNGLESYSGDGGAAAVAQLNGPASVAIDSSGNLYFADSGNHRIRRITPAGSISTVAGNGTPGYSGDGGAAVSAQLNGPLGVAVDASGNVYVADTGNNRVRKVSANGVIATIAGNGNASFYGDEGPALAASIHAPQGLTIAPDGTIYIADTLNQRVRRIGTDGVIHTLAGNGLAAFSGDGTDATKQSLNMPAALALDGSGNVYVADTGNNRVRMVSPVGALSTVAGNGGAGSGGNGTAAVSVSLSSPEGVAVDSAGNLYIAESGANDLRMVGTNGTIATLAGTGECCYSGDGGPANLALLNAPWSVAVDAAGDVYFSDFGNNALRVIEPASSMPAIGMVTNGASNQPGPIAPGEVVVIYGTGLGPAQLTQAAGSPVTQLGSVGVTFNGVAAQMLYASSGQVSAIVPASLSGTSVQVIATYRSLASNTVNASLAAAAPGVFTANSSGSGQAAATNQDGSPNAPGNAAAAGSTLTLLATGLAGNTPSVNIGGTASTVVSTSNVAPGMLAISVQVPGGLGAGSLPVQVSSAGVSSPAGVTVSLR
jgi:trimeric autotransporter adhesin